MSVIVTATAVPVMASLGPLFIQAAGAIVGIASINLAVNVASINIINDDYETVTPYSYSENETDQLNEQTIEKLLKKNLKTTITSKETLLKTLREHGAEIIKDEHNTIECTAGNLKLTFSKENDSEPYNLYAEFLCEETLNTFMTEIDEEYKANAQEYTYNKIIKNLEDKSLSIEQEEIMEDDTIVLTVNLE